MKVNYSPLLEKSNDLYLTYKLEQEEKINSSEIDPSPRLKILNVDSFNKSYLDNEEFIKIKYKELGNDLLL